MSDVPYERYKEALRVGHVAALHGRLEDALVAYDEAALVAPDRALPLTSRASVLVRLGRLDEALDAYGAALGLAPRDESALGGRADALIRAGRPAEAAGALDLLAEIQAVSGRLPEACDTARRALELAESRARRRHLADLTELVRDSPGSEAEAALARAMRVLEEPVGLPAATSALPDSGPAQAEAEAGPGRDDTGPSAEAAPLEPAAGRPPRVELVPVDVAAASARLEAAMASDDPDARIRTIVAVSRELAAAGLDEAALDAADSALGLAPDDPDLHLVLVELYVARGWQTLAGDKLLLLGRLVELTGDAGVRDRLCAAATRLLPDDSRLAGLCA
jgi:tetratricopeptide (TPR) repeat protein